MPTIIGLILLPIGCLLVVGATIALAWETAHLGNSDRPASIKDEIKSNFQKYKAYLLSPLSLAFFLYIIAFIPLLIMPAMGDFGMFFLFAIIIAFTGFSAISPIINLFQPYWWLNTALYIISWFLLFYGIIGTLSWRLGEDASIAAIGFGPAMMISFFVLPISAMIKLVMYLSNRSQNRTSGHL